MTTCSLGIVECVTLLLTVVCGTGSETTVNTANNSLVITSTQSTTDSDGGQNSTLLKSRTQATTSSMWYRSAAQASEWSVTSPLQDSQGCSTASYMDLEWHNITALTSCPAPCCCWSNGSRILVDCGGRGLIETPSVLPYQQGHQGYSYILNMTDNHIRQLQWQPYFIKVEELHLKSNLINFISAQTFERDAFQFLRVLHLHNNNLSHIPAQISRTNLSSLQSLSLHNNPWLCDCFNVWLQWWINQVAPLLVTRTQITCTTLSYPSMRQPIIETDSDQFTCAETKSEVTTTPVLTHPADTLTDEDNETQVFPMYAVALIVSFIAYCLLGSLVAVCYTVRKRMKTGVAQNFDGIAMTGMNKSETNGARVQRGNDYSMYTDSRNETAVSC